MAAPIKLGFVGLSAQNSWASLVHLSALRAPPLSSSYAITAVQNRTAESSVAAAEKYAINGESGHAPVAIAAHHGSSTASIASDPNVDLVAISVKAPDHKASTLPVIAHGKDVFVEWPVGVGLAETKELARAAAEKGVKTIAGIQSWQIPAARKAREWIEQGKIGKVISATYVASKPPESPYFSPFVSESAAYTLEPQRGATFLDIIVGHNLSFITYVLGPLSSVSAQSALMIPEVTITASGAPSEQGRKARAVAPDQWALTGKLADSGVLLTASWRIVNKTTPGAPTLIFIIDGTEGQIRIESEQQTGSAPQVVSPERVFLNGESVDLSEENQAFVNSVGRAWAEFAKPDGAGVYPTFEDAVKIKAALEAVKKSASTGQVVDVQEFL